eukprot:NODE_7676_length_426_cov_319.684636.p3 GENE.NODE_7676_length_426_cov_319.684636~~NODE_7676_length_426_cov_319.684636.p3  ORF type:complete len:83 (+),score=21.73 NODE_7676_length_426_cov_319.684636:3-251(+)
MGKCLQTACLFVMSDYFYCGVAPSQCLSQEKIISAALVCACVMMYAFFGAREGEGPNVVAADAREHDAGALPADLSTRLLRA